MKSISLYQPRDTFIHQGIDPFTKLLYLLCSILAAFFIPTFLGAAILLLINVCLLTWARELSRALVTLTGSLVLLLTIFIIQGLFNPANHTLLWKLGPIHFYQEGLLFALTISFRVVNIIAASSVLVLTTSPSSLMEACVRRGLPAKMGYVTTSILQVIPAMMTSAARIREAQQSRGMTMNGKLIARIKAFIPLLGPVVMSSLMSLQEKAMALEVRAFSVKTKKTFYHEERVLPYVPLLRITMVLATLVIVVWGIVH
jgi:energy-coupling factor transport system permease protein